MRLLLETGGEGACTPQRGVEIIDTEEQEKAVARLRMIGAQQRGMLVGAPLVQAQQYRSIRIEDLAEIFVGGSCLPQTQ